MWAVYERWRIDFFTVPVVDVHHASPDRVEEIEMNFSFQPHSKAKLPIDSISLSIMGGSCMPKSLCAHDSCPYLNADWFCTGCGQPHQTKVSLKGWQDYLLRSQSIHTSSGAEIRSGASFNPVSQTPNYAHTPAFLLSGGKGVNAGRGVILFIHSKGSDAINTGGENDEAKQRLLLYKEAWERKIPLWPSEGTTAILIALLLECFRRCLSPRRMRADWFCFSQIPFSLSVFPAADIKPVQFFTFYCKKKILKLHTTWEFY